MNISWELFVKIFEKNYRFVKNWVNFSRIYENSATSFQNSAIVWYFSAKLSMVVGDEELEDQGNSFLPGSVHKFRNLKKVCFWIKFMIFSLYRNLWMLPAGKLEPGSSSSSSLTTIPSLEEKNQTIVEFWKWEYLGPPFWSSKLLNLVAGSAAIGGVELF
jgi:hypothetical protein